MGKETCVVLIPSKYSIYWSSMFFSLNLGACHRKGLVQVIENGIYKAGVEVILDAGKMEFGEDLIYT